MKKIVRLTESDLFNIVKLIINEGEDNMVLYHGGDNLEGEDIRIPIFLTPDRKIAEWYGFQRGGWINKFHLDINKPLNDMNDFGMVLESIGIDLDEMDDDMLIKLNGGKFYGGGYLDIIYYKPFREAAKELGYDVIVMEDAGNQDTTGLAYLPLYKDKLHFIGSIPLP